MLLQCFCHIVGKITLGSIGSNNFFSFNQHSIDLCPLDIFLNIVDYKGRCVVEYFPLGLLQCSIELYCKKIV